MRVYTSKSPGEAPEKNQDMSMVQVMVEGLDGPYIWSFFSHHMPWVRKKRKVTMLGTVNKNKLQLSLWTLCDKKLTSSECAFTDRAMIVSYCPPKRENVLLMSTVHKDAVLSREDNKTKKTKMALAATRQRGGFNNLDKVTATYSCRCIAARWPLSFSSTSLRVLKF